MPIVAAAFLALLLAGVIENRLHQRALAKIPLRILVNGTRGKTTVTRMAASALNAAGLRTYAKTTGSEARRILPDGSETEYRKRRIVTMMEQLPFVRLAARGKADAIVVECMALRVENQRLMAEKLIRPHYVLMTNAYVDHIEEIGKTEEETVRVLSQSFTDEAVVIAHDRRFGEYAGRLIVPSCQVDASAFQDCPYPVHAENVQLVLALAQELNIPQETVLRAIRNVKPDIGMYKELRLKHLCVRNAFAANDPTSFSAALDSCARQGAYTLLYNHRKDRSYRLEAFAQALRAAACPPGKIGVIGDDKEGCARYIRRITGLPAEAIAGPLAWIHALDVPGGPGQLLCAGNIKGEGRQLLEELMKEAQKYV